MKKFNLSILFLFLTLALFATEFETQKRAVGEFTSIRSSSSIDVVVEQGNSYQLELTAPIKYMDNIFTEVNNGELHIYTKGNMSYTGDIVIHLQVKELTKVSLTGSGDFVTKGKIETPEFSFRISGSGDLSATLNARTVQGSISGSGDVKLSGITNSFEATISGSGDLIASDLHLLTSNLKMNGSGDCKFSGSADSFELYQSGSGDFSGKDFEVEKAKIRKTSSGDARVTVTKSLDISISGSGDLYYSGQPEFNLIQVSGSGDIVKIK